MTSIQEKIGRLAELEENWDSYGASAVDEGIIAAAQSFVASLDSSSQPTGVSATPRGGVHLVWGRDLIELEMDFLDTETINYLESYEGTISAQDTTRAEYLIGECALRRSTGVGEK